LGVNCQQLLEEAFIATVLMLLAPIVHAAPNVHPKHAALLQICLVIVPATSNRLSATKMVLLDAARILSHQAIDTTRISNHPVGGLAYARFPLANASLRLA
jgi:hypothetical protein